MAGGFADKKALVLFSGGQDSTTCLAWALKNFKEVETVGFDYGQRHTAEITCRKHILETIEDVLPYAKGRLGQDHMIDMKVLGQISVCSLTREIEIEFEKDGIVADISVKVDYGYNVASLAFRIQQSIKHNVESMTKFKVDKINVHVQDVDFPDNLA